MIKKAGPIGVFDSGYGGLTVLREIVKELPDYDYLYFGDNARTPYGTRSFETIYAYTLECVKYLFDQGCHLVILACNTASAKALRSIQQLDLPTIDPERRVLGVIRPTAEVISSYSTTKNIAVLGTSGTINSNSYGIEIEKQDASLKVFQQACPLWVPLVENGEYDSDGADFFVEKYLKTVFKQSEAIDTLLLACTHYPLLIEKIRKYVPVGTNIINQGEIVARSLKNYLERHPEMDAKCSKGGSKSFFTTDSATNFDEHGSVFFGESVRSKFVRI